MALPGSLSTSGIENVRDGDFRKDRAAFRIEIANDGHAWPTAAELAKTGLHGAELDAAIKDATSRQIRISSLVEQSPEAENRITLDPDKRDANGMPLPRIHFNYSDYTRAGLDAAQEAHDEVFAALGAANINHSPDIQGAGHIIGTVRMGNDAKDSVVDADLRSFDHRNLFLLGSLTGKMRNLRQAPKVSDRKSRDQRWFGRTGTGIGVRLPRARFRPLRRRTDTPSCR